MKTKGITLLALVVIIILSIMCFVKNRESDGNENRTLATYKMVFRPIKDSVVYKKTPIERFEVALKDQFLFRRIPIVLSLKLDEFLSSWSVSILRKKLGPNQYTFTRIGDYIRISSTDYLSNKVVVDSYNDEKLQIHIDQIIKIHSLYPSIRMYVYQVTQANQTGWFNDFLGVKIPDLFNQLCHLLPSYVKYNHLVYSNLRDYMTNHYKSDHHWNHEGIRRGYNDIYDMMKNDLQLSEKRSPVKQVNFSELYDFKYAGSFARNLGDAYFGRDDFIAYIYNLPDAEKYAIDPKTFEEVPLRSLGLQEDYLNGNINLTVDCYQAYYGFGIGASDSKIYSEGNAIYLIKTKKPETEHNLLIYGDSYNRAFRDVLSSHFKTTIYFQRDIMENYENVYLNDLIEKYKIDTILFSSGGDIWVTDNYVFSFSNEK